MNRLHRALRFMGVYLGISKLKNQGDRLLDRPADMVTLIFDYADGRLKPLQNEQELVELVKETRKLSPRRVLEIGTARGGTLFLWTRLAQPDATIVSIDLPGGRFGGGYPRRRASIYRRFASKKQKVHLLRKDSHAQSSLKQAELLFCGEQIDLLFIDGDHTYEGVKQDWEMYSHMVRPGGIIVFHDIAGNYDDTQVKRLWDAIKPEFRHREYIFRVDGRYGIGVLVKH